MATLIKGLLSLNLDWQFVLVGAFLAVTIELCGVSPLSFAVGAYLPLSTTLPIFCGGMVKALVDRTAGGAGASARRGARLGEPVRDRARGRRHAARSGRRAAPALRPDRCAPRLAGYQWPDDECAGEGRL